MVDDVASHLPEWASGAGRSPVGSSAQRPGRAARLPLDLSLDPLVAAATAPVALFPERFPVAAMAIGVGLLAVPYAVRKAKTGRLSAAPAAAWSVLALVVLAATVGAGRSPDLWGATWPELVRLVWGGAVCLGVVNFCAAGAGTAAPGQTPFTARLAMAGFLAVGLALGLVGLLAMRVGGKFPLLAQGLGWLPAALGGGGALGLGLNPNRVAGLLVLYPAVALALLLAPVARPRAAAWVARLLLGGLLVFFAAALLLTQSRTALLAGGVSVGLVCLLAGRRGMWLLAAAGLVALASLSVFGPARLVGMVAVQSQAEGAALARLLADRDVAGRVLLWQRAWHGILDAPLLGVGLNGFHALAQQPYPRLPAFRPDPDITHAHNLFLQTGLDLGMLGMAALAVLLALAVLNVAKLYRLAPPGTPQRFWAIGMAGALAALLIFNTLDAITLGARPAVAQWILLGLCITPSHGPGQP